MNRLTRPSPSVSATNYAVGKQMKGNDDNMYIVSETKTGIKRWTKKPVTKKKPVAKKTVPLNMFDATTAKAYYESQADFKHVKVKYDVNDLKQKLHQVQSRLKKIGVVLVNAPWKGIGNFIDDAHHYAAKKANNKPYIVTTEHNLFWAERKDGKASLGHEIEDKKLFPLIDAIFLDVFKQQYVTKKMTSNRKLVVKLNVSSK